jgi:starch-binding outer membrane protein, SusD/RagB family
MKKILIYLLVPAFIAMSGCYKEFNNPNAADGSSVVNSAEGLAALIVGLKREYSFGATSALYNVISANGLTTKELYVINTGNGELTALENGKGTVGASNSFLRNIWTSANILKANGQILIDNADGLRAPGTSEPIRVYGHVFKAMALATMAQFWEQVTAEVVTSGEFLNGKRAAFVPRTQALQEAIDLLNAAAPLAEVAPSSFFNLKVGTDINLKNTVNLLLARYNLMLGKYDEALAAAAKVDPAVRSVFRYDNISQNPLFRVSFTTNNVHNGLPNFGLSGALAPDAADGRIAFFLGANAAPVKVQGFYKGDADPIPVYLPGEIALIRAECNARLEKLADAVTHLDAVRTKATDAFGVTAKLPAYSGPQTKEAILEEIYRQRCIELYLSGMKLEDSRRFGRPGPNDANAERSRNFYPYPQVERDNNLNTPADPAI